jgi:2-methylcitrate dehydratase PrpD
LPCALAVAASVDASGEEMLAAYILGLEVASRLSIVAAGRLHKRGFHPTGLIGAFACALIAGRLLRLSSQQLTMAQGIVLSLAAGGSQEFLQEGAWTKRLHPGWGASAGITSATLASEGFIGPTRAYDGRYGLYPLYLEEPLTERLDAVFGELGKVWRTDEISVKPFPICHYNHGAVEAAITIYSMSGFDVDGVASIDCFLPQATHHIVCEPIEIKRRPSNDYDARFSAPYGVAVGLARGRFGLAELAPETRADPVVLDLAAKVSCLIEKDSAFPKYFSGEVVVHMNDGRCFAERVPMNPGCPDRPLGDKDVWAKYLANAKLAMNSASAKAVGDLILQAERKDAATLARFLSNPPPAPGATVIGAEASQS